VLENKESSKAQIKEDMKEKGLKVGDNIRILQ
jgi:hypothetical protein